MFLHVVAYFGTSFLFMDKFYESTAFYLSIHQLVSIWVVPAYCDTPVFKVLFLCCFCHRLQKNARLILPLDTCYVLLFLRSLLSRIKECPSFS